MRDAVVRSGSPKLYRQSKKRISADVSARWNGVIFGQI